MEAGIVGPLFTAGHGATVVTKEEDDGVVIETISFELIEYDADFFIETHDGIEVLGPRLSGYGMVRVVRWDDDLFGIGGFFNALVSIVPCTATVGFGEIDLCEKGLIGFKVGPFVGIPGLLFEVEVPVVLGCTFEFFIDMSDVGSEVSKILEAMGDETDAIGELIAIASVRAVVVGADGHGIHAGHEAGSAGGADGGDGEGVGVADTLFGEIVNNRGDNLGCAVTGKLRAEIFADDP